MASGKADHVWTLEEIAALLDPGIVVAARDESSLRSVS
jgi:hypothetical protein